MPATYQASVVAKAPTTTSPKVWAATENGSITVVQGGSELSVQAEVRAQTQARADQVAVRTVTESDGTMRIEVQWPEGGRQNNEGASLTITLPSAESLQLTSSNGRISVSGGLGLQEATLKTSNGAIELTDAKGKVSADTSNARVELTDVGNCHVDSSNGAVTVVLRDDATGPVKIRTSNARAELTIGKSFGGSISMDTSNARIKAETPRATSVTIDGSEGSVSFGEGATSEVRTSNGAITIKQKQ
jgi:DUF4097 and DUF4098 domain-containing protein YvlB